MYSLFLLFIPLLCFSDGPQHSEEPHLVPRSIGQENDEHPERWLKPEVKNKLPTYGTCELCGKSDIPSASEWRIVENVSGYSICLHKNCLENTTGRSSYLRNLDLIEYPAYIYKHPHPSLAFELENSSAEDNSKMLGFGKDLALTIIEYENEDSPEKREVLRRRAIAAHIYSQDVISSLQAVGKKTPKQLLDTFLFSLVIYPSVVGTAFGGTEFLTWTPGQTLFHLMGSTPYHYWKGGIFLGALLAAMTTHTAYALFLRPHQPYTQQKAKKLIDSFVKGYGEKFGFSYHGDDIFGNGLKKPKHVFQHSANILNLSKSKATEITKCIEKELSQWLEDAKRRQGIKSNSE
ncbi:MAG: hypothetical protein AB7F43_09425 [Bacteriovoracia bacterium]